MKLYSDNNEITRSDTLDETEFSIKATAKAFSILSSSLYSDKILAPIRELCCNAYDSHVAAGKKDVPIEVKLPSVLDPIFYVKDFGTGLSHEHAMRLYTTYFDSTKTDSDEFIGALGLGSKSPFAYTGRFTIESRYNGEKRLYTAFINERGVPSLILLCDPVATDEPSGLTISFPVKKGDESKFSAAAAKALMYFAPTPNVHGYSGFCIHDLQHGIAGDQWAMRTAAYYAGMTGAYCVQGFVSYPVDYRILEEHGLSSAAVQAAKTNLDIFVDIGQVEVAPSREALSYDERTIANLNTKLEVIATAMRDRIQADFDECPDLWTARSKYAHYMLDATAAFKEMFDTLNKQQRFQYKGADLSRNVTLNLSEIRQTSIFAYYHTTRGRKVDRTGQWIPNQGHGSVFKFEVQEGLTIVVDDIVKGSLPVIEAHMNHLMATRGVNRQRLLVIRPTTKASYSDAEIDQILAQFGGVPTVKLSSLNYAIAKKLTSYKKREKGHCLKFTGFMKGKSWVRGDNKLHRVFSRLTWQTEEVDFDAGGFYMPLERFAAVHNGRQMTNLDLVFENAKVLGLLTDDDLDVTYGFSEKDIRAVKGDPDWVNVFSYLEEKIRINIDNGLYPGALVQHEIANSVIGKGLGTFVSDAGWKATQPKLSRGLLKTLLEDLVDFNDRTQLIAVDPIKEICENLAIDYAPAVTATASTFKQQWSDVLQAYPMFRLLDWTNIGQLHRDIIIDYANTVEASHSAALKAA